MSAYFTKEFIDFFKELTVNNHKDWFDKNRKRYIQHVKDPFYGFVSDLITEVRKEDDRVNLMVKDAVFRINKDIRFSKDKWPYKLHVASVVSRGGRKNMQIPGIYVHLGIGGCSFGGGSYMPDKERLALIRQKIASNPKAFESLVQETRFQKRFGGLKNADRNKVLPKEWKEVAQEHPILFNKQFYYMQDYDGEKTLLRDDLLKFTMAHYQDGRAVNHFLDV